ncbi:hypothetical protein ACTPEM_25065, partial [Clostridioides difficile]
LFDSQEELDTAFSVQYSFVNIGSFIGTIAVGILYLKTFAKNGMKGSSPTYLKRAVELLIENKIMSVNSIVSSLEEFGINLYPED